MTNCLSDSENDLSFVEKTRCFCQAAGYRYLPVKLLLSEEENLKRLPSPDRKAKMKLTDENLFKSFCQSFPLITQLPEGKTLDITGLSAEETSAALQKLAQEN
jgi:hypothetical protein